MLLSSSLYELSNRNGSMQNNLLGQLQLSPSTGDEQWYDDHTPKETMIEYLID